jgi:hypothetical protein
MMCANVVPILNANNICILYDTLPDVHSNVSEDTVCLQKKHEV